MTMTVRALGEELSGRYAEQTAYTYKAQGQPPQSLTYAELQLLSARMAGYFYERGVRKGHYMAFYCDNPLHSAIAYWACLKLGAVCMPLNMEDDRFYRVLDVLSPDAFFVSASMLPALTPHISGSQQLFLHDAAIEAAQNPQIAMSYAETPLGGNDPAFLYFTSGSTGLPKGVMLSHSNLVSYTLLGGQNYKFHSTDSFLCHAPLHSDMSLFPLFLPLAAGARCVLISPRQRWNPQYVKNIILEERISTLFLVPSALRLLLLVLREEEELSRVNSLFLSGEKASLSEVRSAQIHFTNAQVYNLYGNTECNDILAYPIPADAHELADLPLGKPLPYVKTLLLDDALQPCRDGEIGELYVSSPTVMHGYYSSRETGPTQRIPGHQELFFPTKDLMTRKHGVYYYVSRKDNMVKISGQRVYLSAVESVIKQHSEVVEAAVIAITHENRVQLSAAVHGSFISVNGLREHCSTYLPPYAVPASFWISEVPLPKTTTGKTDYQELKRQFI